MLPGIEPGLPVWNEPLLHQCFPASHHSRTFTQCCNYHIQALCSCKKESRSPAQKLQAVSLAFIWDAGFCFTLSTPHYLNSFCHSASPISFQFISFLWAQRTQSHNKTCTLVQYPPKAAQKENQCLFPIWNVLRTGTCHLPVIGCWTECKRTCHWWRQHENQDQTQSILSAVQPPHHAHRQCLEVIFHLFGYFLHCILQKTRPCACLAPKLTALWLQYLIKTWIFHRWRKVSVSAWK